MKKEDLIKLGLTEEQANAALVIHGKDIESHKAKLEALTTENQALFGQVTEATSTIESFKKLDVSGIQAAADQWKTKAEQAEDEIAQAREEAENAIAETEFNYALRDALLQANARNPVAVSALLDFDKLSVNDDGEITGLKDQLETIRSENEYLFIPESDDPQIVLGGNSNSIINDVVVEAARTAAGLKPTS